MDRSCCRSFDLVDGVMCCDHFDFGCMQCEDVKVCPEGLDDDDYEEDYGGDEDE